MDPRDSWRIPARLVPLTLLLCLSPQTPAACQTSTNAVGDSTSVCDSGALAPPPVSRGNNTLILPVGSTVQIQGNIVNGAGQDVLEMHGGTVTGAVDQGAGRDTVLITGGSVTGDINQGEDPDSFTLRGGSIGSLTQGNGRDTFVMSGGTIVGAFEDGDIAYMSGGSIGRVDMKLDNNLFDLSNGTIIGNLVTGLGNDTIIVSGGRVGGAISTSSGVDTFTLTGGQIDGGIRAGFGNDSLIWNGGGTVRGVLDMAGNDDSAVLRRLDDTLLGPTTSLDGGPGADSLTLEATITSVPSRLVNWETLAIRDNSRLDLAADALVLGDSGTLGGTVSIDGSSTLVSTSGTVRPFASGGALSVSNAGTLDLTRSGAAPGNTLTLDGDYTGNDARLLVRSVLAGDGAASDRLIVSRGAISGNTLLQVSNAGGLGGQTVTDGIQVVQATNGATSQASAFRLGAPLSAGAYQYYLFKGGVTAGSENSWYLRSSVAAAPAATPSAPTDPQSPRQPQSPGEPGTPTSPIPPTPPVGIAPPTAAEGTPPLPVAAPGSAPITLYRLEVPSYSAIQPALTLVQLNALGTFHDRQGEQSLLRGTGALPAGWGRLTGKDIRQRWSGTVQPRLDANVQGYQVGHDLFASAIDGNLIQRAGFFVGHSELDGDVNGFAEGFEDRRSGRLNLRGDHLGLYWTLIGEQGGYLDAVAMGSRFDGHARSDRGVGINTRGTGLALSLEGGLPIPLSDRWWLEPQAQLIYQRLDLDSRDDGISRLSFDSQPQMTGRLGARLKGRFNPGGMPVEPYARLNVWHSFGGYDTVTFDDTTRIRSEHRGSSADAGIGVVARMSRGVALYAGADYSANLDSQALEGVSGNVGLRIDW